jgi:hypothetical protein
MKTAIVGLLAVFACVYAFGEAAPIPEWATAQQAQELRVDLAQLKLRVGKLEREMIQLKADVAVRAKAEPKEEDALAPQDKPLRFKDFPSVASVLDWTSAQRSLWEESLVGQNLFDEVAIVDARRGSWGRPGGGVAYRFSISGEGRIEETRFPVVMYTNDANLAGLRRGQRLAVLGEIFQTLEHAKQETDPRTGNPTRTYLHCGLAIDVKQFQRR